MNLSDELNRLEKLTEKLPKGPMERTEFIAESRTAMPKLIKALRVAITGLNLGKQTLSIRTGHEPWVTKCDCDAYLEEITQILLGETSD